MKDGFGRVFFHNGAVYRAIFPAETEYCDRLLKSNLFKELSEKKYLPETVLTSYNIPGYSQVLQHERLLEIAQHEWSFDMLKDAAMLVWEINNICNQHGYELKDAHTLNILFRGTQPVLSDLGSISPRKNNNSWFAFEEYLSSFIIPLVCWSRGMTYLTRKLLESHFYQVVTLPSQSITESGILEMIPDFELKYSFCIKRKPLFSLRKDSKLLKRFAKVGNSILSLIIGRPTSFFKFDFERTSLAAASSYFDREKLKENILKLDAPRSQSAWNAYHSQYYKTGDQIKFSERFETLANIIEQETNIKSVIDLAGNEGYFCSLLQRNNNLQKIILTDYDENAINSGYCRFKTGNDKRIHTAFLNFMFTQNQNDTEDRLRCDLAVALAVTHHLILSAGFSLQVIFERLAGFSNEYVLIEFMPLGLWAAGEVVRPLPEWYNSKWFRDNFERYFQLINEQQTEQNRILFFGRKKSNLEA